MPSLIRQRHFAVCVPIPSGLPPHLVLAHLQTCTPTLRHNATAASFEEHAPDPAAIAEDPFFGPFDDTVRAFKVREISELVPGARMTAWWAVVMQPTPNGLSFRVKTRAGLTLWARWTIQPRAGAAPSPYSDVSSPSDAGDEWELFDQLSVECNKLLMPFVCPYAERVHYEVCRRLVDEVLQNYINGSSPE